MFPTGIAKIREYYGDPNPHILPDGGISYHWEYCLDFVQLPAPLYLGWDVSRAVTRVRIHYRLSQSLNRIFYDILEGGNWPKIVTFDGTYAWRAKRTGDKLSTHGWGIAIDLNARANQLGTEGHMPKEIVDAFKREGWEWGGHWPYPDPMHFQACYGY